MSSPLCFFALTTGLLLTFSPITSYAAQHTPVELWRVGDDGLTIKFADALESEFKASRLFVLSCCNKPGTLVVTISKNVGWRRIGRRTQVLYSVEFTSVRQVKIGSSTGVCWASELRKCATQVVGDAASALDIRVHEGDVHVQH